MKKALLKKENIIYVILFFLLLIVHLPILIKPLFTGDVLLNNSFYNGYSWEISLGRFGLYLVGLLKSYLSIPSIETFISFFLIIGTTYLLLHLFDVKDVLPKVFIIILMTVSPIISATLLFHYCSVPYFIAFFCGVLSVVVYYESNNKYIRYLLPVILMIISLSMYQAYFSLIVTVFFLYQIHLLLKKQFHFKQSLIYLLLFIIGVFFYFLLMKLSLFVFHIDMSSYSNANSVGISTLLQIPNKVIDSYQLFYEMYFTDTIMKNTFFGNTYLHAIVLLFFFLTVLIKTIKSTISWKEKALVIALVLLLPVFLNSVIFVINDAKLQLLMSASYLVFFIFLLSLSYEKHLRMIFYLILIILLRNYCIQDQATYLTLENTYHAYDTIIGSTIKDHLGENKKYIVIGNISSDPDISKRNYGYISDEGLFWEEYNLRKLGFERFCRETYGLSIPFGEEDLYQNALNHPHQEAFYEEDDTIFINLNQFQ